MLKHLFEQWNEVSPVFKARKILLFLDFDGTLTPIVQRPELARLPPRARKVLSDLSRSSDVTVCVVSGRSLPDLKNRVRIPGLVYAGNHGFEIDGPKISHVHPSADSFKDLLKKIAKSLELVFKPIPGILVENKKFTLSIHYRMADPQKVDYAKLLLFREIGGYLGKSQVVLTEGKKVWEIRPPIEWNKGRTVLWLFARLLAKSKERVLPVFIGDDMTDEDAFKALRHRGMGIRVTDEPEKPTEAAYFLYSPAEVFSFLKRLSHLKSSERKN